MSPNKKLKSSEFKYDNKYSTTDTPAYDRVLNALKKLDTSYNPTMPRIHHPVIEGNYKVNRDTRVIIFVEHEEEEM